MKIKVLSLFDGISVAQQALKELGYDVEYYASEIDKYAIQITQKNHPNTIQWGSVTTIDGTYFTKDGGGEIDLLIGGSPCQDLSISQSKKRKGLSGSKSSLFYEYLRILKEIKPRYFVLENVASMSDESRDIITNELGVLPIELNAKDFSAQNRARYFWSNLPIEQPVNTSNLVLKDILQHHTDVDEKYWYKNVPFTAIIPSEKSVVGTINVSGHDILKRIYNWDCKSPTITTCGGGNTQHKILDRGGVRKLTTIEYERLQSLPDNYTEGISNSQRYKCLGNAFNKEVVKHILKNIK